MFKKKIIFLVGPTASGKSEVAVSLAKKINAEIISCDSMQIYRGMDILTSKPSKKLIKKVPHYLLGSVRPGQDYNAARFRQDALKACEKIYKKGKIPLFVGGTGLYMSIVIDGLFESAFVDRSIRLKLEQEAKLKGNKPLYLRLKKVDPQAALKIHPHDGRRVIRALEVFLKTGKPISKLQISRQGLGKEYTCKIFALNLNRDELYRRIDARVERMFKQGLINEAKKFLAKDLSRNASYALGLRELGGYFKNKYDLAQAKRLIKRNSRHYAKRQLTWFRKDKRVKWIRIKDKEPPREIATKIFKRYFSDIY